MIRQVLSLTKKDLKILLKDRNGIAVLLVMPMMFIVVMTLALERSWTGTPNIVQHMVPGWTLFGVFFIAMVLANRILEEKRIGTFQRLKAAPVSRTALLLGKVIPFVVMNLVQIVLMFAAGMFVMPLIGAPRLGLGGHPGALALISLAASLAATALGLLIAGLSRTTEQVGGIGNLLVVTMAALGGAMVPRATMPGYMQTIGLLTPHAWALGAYQIVMIRGAGVTAVATPLVVLLAFALLFFGVAAWRFDWD
jgi:ABC-2 type transport system permease protein